MVTLLLLAGILLYAAGQQSSQADPLFPGSLVGPGFRFTAITGADFNQDGLTDLAGARPNGSLEVLLSNGDGSFAIAGPSVSLTKPVYSMMAADISGDGKPDLLLTTDSTLQLLVNYGSGRLGSSSTYVSARPAALAVGDLDGDGTNDLAVARYDNSVRILYTAPGFIPHPSSEVTLAVPGVTALAIGDFDSDGRQDLSIVRGCGVSTSTCDRGLASILLNVGNGVFQQRQPIELGGGARSMVTADFDEDGRRDIAALNPRSNDISILLGAGDGSLSQSVDFAVGMSASYDPSSLATRDWNHDGHQDLVALGSCALPGVYCVTGQVAMLTGRGDGTFDGFQLFEAGSRSGALATGDFNGDDNYDVATNSMSEDIWSGGGVLLLGNNDGSLVAQVRFQAFEPKTVLTGDLNGDGRKDLIVASGVLTVYLADDRGGFHPLAPLANSPNAMALGDFNRDGIPDLAVSFHGDSILTRLGNGDGTFQPGILFPAPYRSNAIAVADFDGDGDDDLAVANEGPYSDIDPDFVSILLGDGSGQFGPAQRYGVGPSPGTLVLGDYNGDQKVDIAVRDVNGVAVLSGLGDGTFTSARASSYGGSYPPAPMARGDFNADGKEDLVVPIASLDYYSPHVVRVLFGQGDGTFLQGTYLYQTGSPLSVAAADFNADGRVDIAVGTAGRGYYSFGGPYPAVLSIYLGRGDGTFDSGGLMHTLEWPAIMISDDLNADGRPDLTLTGRIDAVLVLFNTGPLPDADGDGVLNFLDTCTDTDGDGYGDPGFSANTCPLDDCPRSSDPSQADADLDGIGDICDRCTDTDHDEWGDPGVPLNVCPVDNCPITPSLSQEDLDHDGSGNACDPCTDPDGDGYGTFGYACPADNCILVGNPDQADEDGDLLGDVCDACPHDSQNDSDHDGACGDIDNCPISNPAQADTEGDGVGDVCDNCPTVGNLDQLDTNADGSGDACQPSLVLTGIREGADHSIQVSVATHDPQNEPLSGAIEIFESRVAALSMGDLIATMDCGQGWFPEGHPGEGIGFVFGSVGQPLAVDFLSLTGYVGMNCGADQYGSYLVRAGLCGGTGDHDYGSSILDLTTLPLPAPICVTKWSQLSARFDATILSLNENSMELAFADVHVLRVPFESGLPRQIDISSLSAGADHRVKITLTDGNTVPVTIETSFDYHGESTMRFNNPPEAVISPVAAVECDRPEGGLVTLDGSDSRDTDSNSGTHDDVVLFEWLETAGSGDVRLLGTGERLSRTFPLGAHDIVLRVTDSAGDFSTMTVTVHVVDTQGPVIDCPAMAPEECAGPQGTGVAVTASASDACGAPVAIENDRTPGGADASDIYPLGTTRLSFRATDTLGNASTCVSSIVVRDTTPPSLTVTVEPPVLWPPNHRLMPVGTQWNALDRCDPYPHVILSSIASSEPDDIPGNGDGATTGDIQDDTIGSLDTMVLLRAERWGGGPGRVYTMTYVVQDSSGNSSSALGAVTVPHDLGTGPEPLIVNVEGAGPPGRAHLYWNGVPGAESYDLIRGDLGYVVAHDETVWLGPIRVLAAGTIGTSHFEEDTDAIPPVGRALFYLVQYWDAEIPSGWGTESSAWPTEPSSCDVNCPGDVVGIPTSRTMRKR